MVIVIEIIPQNLNVQLLSQWNGIYRVDKNSLTKFTPWKRQRDLVCMKRPWLINIWTNDTFSSSANYLFRNEYLTFIHPFMNRNYQEVLVTCRKSEYRQTINIINIIHIYTYLEQRYEFQTEKKCICSVCKPLDGSGIVPCVKFGNH